MLCVFLKGSVYSKNDFLIDLNFICTSFHSFSSVLSGIIPAPANNVSVFWCSFPQRRFTKMSASPFDEDWNPTTPEYSSRSCDSAVFMADNAVDVGYPNTAGVGWSSLISEDNDSDDVNEMSVQRCCIIPAAFEYVVPTEMFASISFKRFVI